MPSIAYRALSKRASVARHRQVTPLPEPAELTVRSSDEHPLPLQVDGDYIGEVHRGPLLGAPSRACRRFLTSSSGADSPFLGLRSDCRSAKLAWFR